MSRTPKNDLPPLPSSEKPAPVSKKTRWQFALMLLNTAWMLGLYYGLLHAGFFFVEHLYVGLFILLGLAYVLWNRFFVRRGKTPEDLDPQWSEEKKEAYFREDREWKEKSKWLLIGIFPLAVTLTVDCFILYILPFWSGNP